MGVKKQGDLPIVDIAKIDSLMFEMMVKIGQVGVEYAIRSHEFDNQTHNLEDSYGFAVFKDGQLQGQPMVADPKAVKPAEHEGSTYWGYIEGWKALKNFEAPTSGWSVVVVADQVSIIWERMRSVSSSFWLSSWTSVVCVVCSSDVGLVAVVVVTGSWVVLVG